jgi:hypothetical protein
MELHLQTGGIQHGVAGAFSGLNRSCLSMYSCVEF